jgi:hypothetical protein
MLETPSFSPKHLLAGGVVLLSFGLIFEQIGGRLPPIANGATQPVASPLCTKVIKPKSSISRQALANLLTIPEGKSRATIRGIVAEPYCKMPNLEVRAGITSERDIYPLEFDPQTWLVVLYEGDNYAGYDFMVR